MMPINEEVSPFVIWQQEQRAKKAAGLPTEKHPGGPTIPAPILDHPPLPQGRGEWVTDDTGNWVSADQKPGPDYAAMRARIDRGLQMPEIDASFETADSPAAALAPALAPKPYRGSGRIRAMRGRGNELIGGDYDTFYNDLRMYGLSDILKGRGGEDKKFGKAHEEAFKALQAAKARPVPQPLPLPAAGGLEVPYGADFEAPAAGSATEQEIISFLTGMDLTDRGVARAYARAARRSWPVTGPGGTVVGHAGTPEEAAAQSARLRTGFLPSRDVPTWLDPAGADRSLYSQGGADRRLDPFEKDRLSRRAEVYDDKYGAPRRKAANPRYDMGRPLQEGANSMNIGQVIQEELNTVLEAIGGLRSLGDIGELDVPSREDAMAGLRAGHEKEQTRQANLQDTEEMVQAMSKVGQDIPSGEEQQAFMDKYIGLEKNPWVGSTYKKRAAMMRSKGEDPRDKSTWGKETKKGMRNWWAARKGKDTGPRMAKLEPPITTQKPLSAMYDDLDQPEQRELWPIEKEMVRDFPKYEAEMLGGGEPEQKLASSWEDALARDAEPAQSWAEEQVKAEPWMGVGTWNEQKEKKGGLLKEQQEKEDNLLKESFDRMKVLANIKKR